ncbi:MAG TPA: hypothetical protein VM580_34075 [Labilithrix sp.]|nr:hypothetical protein [Labilithrix sp.]
MPDHDTKPTPPSGMPAAVAATSVAKPSVDTAEIAAPKSEATIVILAALDGLRGEVSSRFERLETTTAAHGEALKTLANQVSEHTKNIADQSSALTSVAKSAAVAAELSAQALSKVNTAQDEAKKMVESAMAIQKGAIESAVRVAVQPILDDVERQNEALGAVVNELGIEDRVELGRKVVPGEKTPETALKKIDKRAKHSTLVQLVIAVGVIVNALWQLIQHH